MINKKGKIFSEFEFQLFFFFEITELTASLECVFGQSSGIKRQAETSSVKWAETEGFCAKDIIVSLAKNSDKKKSLALIPIYICNLSFVACDWHK